MSQNALARLCGVTERALFADGRIVAKLSQEDTRTKDAPECLKEHQGKVFETELKGDSGQGVLANIVNSDAAAAIIEYYAYESKAANETAKKSFRAFAKLGIERWIKDLTGYKVENADILQAVSNSSCW